MVADNQYAPLGLLLIGILARLRSVLKFLGKELGIEIEMEEIEKPVLAERGEGKAPENEVGNDFGEVVARTTVAGAEKCGLGEESPAVSKNKDEKSTLR